MCECITYKGVKSTCKCGLTPHVHAEQSANKLTPHIHADCIKAWADGATIEFFNPALGEWRITPSPRWIAHTKYRIKLKEKVKKWRYVLRHSRTGRLEVSENYYSSGGEANAEMSDYTAIEKIEATMKGFDSD